MAEVAASLLAAEQVVSTGVEAGVAASIAKPTVPLKASFSQIGSTSEDDTKYASNYANTADLSVLG